MKLTFSVVRGEAKAAFLGLASPIAVASTAAVRAAADLIQTEGRAAIASAGFPLAWQRGLRAVAYPKRGASIDSTAYVNHSRPYIAVFEYGEQISGKPMLWVPVSGLPKGMTAAQYVATIGPLHSVNRPGYPPMLVGPVSGNPGVRVSRVKLKRGAAGVGRRITMTVLFIGLTAVQIKKRLDLEAIYDKARAGLAASFNDNLRN